MSKEGNTTDYDNKPLLNNYYKSDVLVDEQKLNQVKEINMFKDGLDELENEKENFKISDSINYMDIIEINQNTNNNGFFTNVQNNNNNNQTIYDDINPLHFQVKKLQKLLIVEQDRYSKIQTKLQESESQRLELLSSSNKETFGLTTQLTKLRNEFEKNEAIRRTLEYELTLARSSLNKEKNLTNEKDKITEESTKFYEDQLKLIKKENLRLNSHLNSLEEKYSKKDSDSKKLLAINKEQESLISSLKEESSLNKDIIEKLKLEIEIYKEKANKNFDENDQINKKIQKLEENLKKETEFVKDLKLILESEKAKNFELNNKLKLEDEKKIELELNFDKLIDQLKENRKELLEEQTISKEMKERFKLIETELKLTNADLNKKLEEKISAIKNLSSQLNLYEKEVFSIKNELKQTNSKQSEFDKTYESCIKDSKKIIKFLMCLSNDLQYEGVKQFQASLDKIKVDCKANLSPVLLNKQFEILKRVIEDYSNFLRIKHNETNDWKQNYEKLKTELQNNDKKYKELDHLNHRLQNDIDLLRSERQALEEVVQSFRNECEALKMSLTKQFEINDSLKMKLNFYSKRLKESEDC